MNFYEVDNTSALQAKFQAQQIAFGPIAFRAAVALIPDSAPAHNNLGVALASAGAVAEAATHFAEAVRLQPDFTEARQNLAAATGGSEAR